MCDPLHLCVVLAVSSRCPSSVHPSVCRRPSVVAVVRPFVRPSVRLVVRPPVVAVVVRPSVVVVRRPRRRRPSVRRRRPSSSVRSRRRPSVRPSIVTVVRPSSVRPSVCRRSSVVAHPPSPPYPPEIQSNNIHQPNLE